MRALIKIGLKLGHFTAWVSYMKSPIVRLEWQEQTSVQIILSKTANEVSKNLSGSTEFIFYHKEKYWNALKNNINKKSSAIVITQTLSL